MELRQHVLRLYRSCLKSARKCPEYHYRELMKEQVKVKFHHAKPIQDKQRIMQLLKEGQEELDRMEYYHSLQTAKREKQQEKEKTEKKQLLAKVCANCSTPFLANAKFCSNCGVKRVSLV